MYKWINVTLNKAYRRVFNMATQSSLDPLKELLQVIYETNPPTKPVIGYSWVPRFLEQPPVEMTKALICGVDCDEVYPNIFVGDEGSARKKDFLQAVGITHVLNTAEGSNFGQVNTGTNFYADAGIKYLGFDLIDAPRTRIIDYFDEGVNFIDDGVSSGGKVLVHCLMGLSRSATFVAAYLMIKKNMKAKEALRTIRKQREVRPNDGFLVQLLQLEAKGLDK
ncbi:dual specificity protein phosphatase 3-like isoform X1 [Argiope bruennichi]|uniref:Dual specificity protein phosphatase n=2 Tax=Argiope bruennichi TaxID=94029 RepID=A0A8T0F8N9_ARGBR|nr:dual specificity protein phosphatase 3-like isoform X1 [Argiope bruennichi]KAF8787576.1 Dual specificity protein phosphatase 3 like protein [Argiope bruennichi]